MSAKLKNLWPQKKSICFYNSPFLDWKHGCVWCVATILFECGNMWRKYPLDSLLDFFCTPTLPFLIQHDMKKVGGELETKNYFFRTFFYPHLSILSAIAPHAKSQSTVLKFRLLPEKKYHNININRYSSRGIHRPAIQAWLIDSNFGKTFAIINLKLNTQKKILNIVRSETLTSFT